MSHALAIIERLGYESGLWDTFIRTDSNMRMYTHFYSDEGGRPPFPIDSFFDVFTGKIPADNRGAGALNDFPSHGRSGRALLSQGEFGMRKH